MSRPLMSRDNIETGIDVEPITPTRPVDGPFGLDSDGDTLSDLAEVNSPGPNSQPADPKCP